MKKIFTILIMLVAIMLPLNMDAKKKHHKTKHRKIEHVAIGTVTHGKATYYGDRYHKAHHTANGDTFNMYAMTCASNTHPFGTKLKVTNKNNGKSVVVTVTDRGGFKPGNVDLTYGAFKLIAALKTGVIPVTIEVVG